MIDDEEFSYDNITVNFTDGTTLSVSFADQCEFIDNVLKLMKDSEYCYLIPKENIKYISRYVRKVENHNEIHK